MLGLGIVTAIGNALSIASALLDPEKKDKSFTVAMRKNGRKALNIAEDIFDLIDENQNQLPLKTLRQYKKLKKRFNDLD